MGISIWKSIGFFLMMAFAGIWLFPSNRERGKLYLDSGTFDEARFYLEKQYHEDPNDVSNTVRYLDALKINKEDYLFEKIAKKSDLMIPDNVKLKKMIADYYLARMDVSEASVYLDDIVRLSPENKDLFDELEGIYYLYKQYDKLIALYNYMIFKKRDDLEICMNLGRIYALHKAPDKAEKIYKHILEKYPSEVRAKDQLAEIYDYKGETEKAARMYKEIIAARPEDRGSWDKLIGNMLKMGAYNDLFDSLREYTETFPGDKQIIDVLYGKYETGGKNNSILVLMEQMASFENVSPILYKVLGEIFFYEKEYDQSKEWIVEYNEKTGGDHTSYHLLGDILAAGGDDAGAKREYERALSLLRAGQ